MHVPEHLRPWDVDWPEYAPVDITPPELRPEGIAASIGWAEPILDPREIDWPRRQAVALLPYRVVDGVPLNPTGRTGRCGRNLGRWGENAAADPIVVAGTGPDRRVLLIRRSDCGQWAIPGGMVDPGETAPAALVRELREETGVDLAGVTPQKILARTYVDDPRNSDHAWVCSTVALYRLPAVVPAAAGDDAVDARWVRCADMDTLIRDLAGHGAELYEAHRPLLQRALAAL